MEPNPVVTGKPKVFQLWPPVFMTYTAGSIDRGPNRRLWTRLLVAAKNGVFSQHRQETADLTSKELANRSETLYFKTRQSTGLFLTARLPLASCGQNFLKFCWG